MVGIGHGSPKIPQSTMRQAVCSKLHATGSRDQATVPFHEKKAQSTWWQCAAMAMVSGGLLPCQENNKYNQPGHHDPHASSCKKEQSTSNSSSSSGVPRKI